MVMLPGLRSQAGGVADLYQGEEAATLAVYLFLPLTDDTLVRYQKNLPKSDIGMTTWWIENVWIF